MSKSYRDPTAETAIANVMREQRKKQPQPQAHSPKPQSMENRIPTPEKNLDVSIGDCCLGWTADRQPERRE